MRLRNKMMFKKMAALLLAGTVTIGSGMAASAAAGDQIWTDYPNLTNYETAYSFTVPQGTAREIPLQVRATNNTWIQYDYFTEAQLLLDKDITWNMVGGSVEGVDVDVESSLGDEVSTGKYAAKSTAYVEDYAKPGLAVVEAKNPVNHAMDYTIVVNPASPAGAVSGVKVYAYNKGFDANAYLGSNTNATVATTAVDSGINYVTAMDAISGVTEDYEYIEQYGSYMLRSVTIGGETLTNTKDSTIGWQYRVYDSSGTMKDVSKIAGAETMNIETGDTVVWAYGAYDGLSFPTNANNLPVPTTPETGE